MRNKKPAPNTRQSLIDPLELPAPPFRPRSIPVTVPSIRTGTTRRKPWTAATGSTDTLRGKAIFYLLKAFDYKSAWMLDTAEMSLAKVVCTAAPAHAIPSGDSSPQHTRDSAHPQPSA